MASNRCEVFVLVMVMIAVMITGGATTHSDCRNVIVSLSPCINYVCGNSPTPSYSCCSELANVVKSQPRCLCALVKGGNSNMGFKINETLAMGLPSACSIHTPPVSRCHGNVSQPVPAPAPTTPPKSDGTTIKLPYYFSFVFLLVASNMYA